MPTADSQPPFAGFPAGARAVPLPAALFTTLMPAIDDVAELIVTLYAATAVQRLRRYPRFLDAAVLRGERPLVETLARLLPHEEVDVSFRRGLDAAVARGALLRARAQERGQTIEVITLNTDADRRALERVRQGQITAPLALATESSGSGVPRSAPNVYAIYESTIGPITPQIADELAEAEGLYPAIWIADAFREAAELNKRSWRYVQRILERWQSEGRDDATTGRHPGQRPDSRYEHLIQQ